MKKEITEAMNCEGYEGKVKRFQVNRLKTPSFTLREIYNHFSKYMNAQTDENYIELLTWILKDRRIVLVVDEDGMEKHTYAGVQIPVE